MSINLVSLVTRFLTPDMIDKIAVALGASNSTVGKALSAAVPSLLGGLAGVASTPEGSRRLLDAVDQQKAVGPESLLGMIGGAGHQGVVNNGSNLLSSLLGGTVVSSLGAALSKFAGLGGSSGTSLLGLLTPLVMGVLGRETAASGLDASGLSQLLTSQKANVAAAMPAGFADLLKGAGLLERLGIVSTGTSSPDRPAVPPAGRPRVATAGPPGMPSWVRWAIPLLVLAFLGWWYLGQRATNLTEATREPAQTTRPVPAPADQAARAPEPVPPVAQNLAVGSVDLGDTARSALNSLQQSLSGVTDPASATAALPRLGDATDKLNQVSSLASQLPPDGKSALAAVIAASRPSLDALFARVLAVPGVADVVRTPIDGIKTKLDAIAALRG